MDNENKWEYDYSTLYNSSGSGAGSSGYINAGSSGTNSANQPDASGRAPSAEASGSSYYGSACTAPEGGGPVHSPDKPKKPRRSGGAGKVLRSVLALVLVAAVGFGSGYAGGLLSGRNSGPRMVVQSVERNTSALNAASTSTSGNDLTLPQVSALVSPSVVVITTEQVVYSTWSWYGQSQVQSGAGSGVIISEDGYIMTCAHVISGASNITVTVGDKDYTATVVGQDDDSDIAIIKVEATGLTPAVMGDSAGLTVGEEVVAVGNPLGELGGTITNGIISALNRSVSVEGKTMTLIQTNASVSPGNSGGGLFNMAGELVGIVNAKSSDSGAEGLGFAIPINSAMQIAQDLLENGYVTGRPAMGITVYAVTDAAMAQQMGVSAYGVYIVSVEAGSGAEKAGLQPGDRIVSVDNTEVTVNEDLTSAIQQHKVGDTLSLTIARDGQMMTFDVVLGEKNAPAQSPAGNSVPAPGKGNGNG